MPGRPSQQPLRIAKKGHSPRSYVFVGLIINRERLPRHGPVINLLTAGRGFASQLGNALDVVPGGLRLNIQEGWAALSSVANSSFPCYVLQELLAGRYDTQLSGEASGGHSVAPSTKLQLTGLQSSEETGRALRHWRFRECTPASFCRCDSGCMALTPVAAQLNCE